MRLGGTLHVLPVSISGNSARVTFNGERIHISVLLSRADFDRAFGVRVDLGGWSGEALEAFFEAEAIGQALKKRRGAALQGRAVEPEGCARFLWMMVQPYVDAMYGVGARVTLETAYSVLEAMAVQQEDGKRREADAEGGVGGVGAALPAVTVQLQAVRTVVLTRTCTSASNAALAKRDALGTTDWMGEQVRGAPRVAQGAPQHLSPHPHLAHSAPRWRPPAQQPRRPSSARSAWRPRLPTLRATRCPSQPSTQPRTT